MAAGAVQAVFDTTVLVDARRGDAGASGLIGLVLQGRLRAGVSVLTLVEFWQYSKLTREDEAWLDGLMQLLADVPFGRPIAKEVAGALRPLTQKQKQKQRLFRDAVTALSAKALGIPVYTRDLADLRRFYAEVLPY